jgi:hypothetical protein
VIIGVPGGGDDTAFFDKPFIADALPGTVELFKNLLRYLPWGLVLVILLLGLACIELIHEQPIVFSDWRLWLCEERGDGDGEGQVGRQMQSRRTIVHPVRRKACVTIKGAVQQTAIEREMSRQGDRRRSRIEQPGAGGGARLAAL